MSHDDNDSKMEQLPPTAPLRSAPPRDENGSSQLNEYCITISPRTTMDQSDRRKLCTWHSRFESVLLVAEDRPSDGVEHYHSLIASPVKSAQAITRQLITLYKSNQWEFVKGVTIRVKTCVDRIGWFHYLTKDLGGNAPLGIKGWKMTWIKEQCLNNLKKMPHKMLARGQYMVNPKVGTRLVIEYAKARAIPLSGKEGFKQVLCAMAADGYQFEGAKLKFLYAQVMAMTGDSRAFASLIDNELHFLD